MPRLMIFLAFLAVLPSIAGRTEDWPAWRGPTGQGVSAEEKLPERWGPEENVVWKVDLPGPGNSTPIVIGKKVLLTQAVEKGKKRSLLCLDRDDGRILWTKEVLHPAPEPTHGDNHYCSASPASDGERVVVSHGSAGVFAYDLDGKELWRAEVGKLHHVWGNAASPVLHGDLCFINCGPGERTFLLALDKRTGKKAWRVDIPGGLEGGDAKTWTGSWCTPLLLRTDGREDLVVGYPGRLRGYDPASGEERWSCEGLGKLVYASPVAGDGIIAALSGFTGPGMGVRAGGKGDVTATHRLWRHDKAPQRIGSGIVLGGKVLIVNETGVGEWIELASGKTLNRRRVCGTTWSSPVLADGKLYVLDQDGDCNVVRPTLELEPIARSSLGETVRASPAISGGRIFIRTYRRLWCLGN